MNASPPGPKSDNYVVVARRYRPQTFADLIGQEHIGQALAGAISTNRVGHAYLFTGARGVGKTSAARIFAKALNCQQGPTAEPCNRCDTCLDITAGSDLDVIEIDAASNRGIDEIRVLRENVGKGTARDRYKVYIIDEVHMLTREAFNALLKTLEEPPRHVKFIFCTTEAEKIPITILSRCQRFDFAGIQAPSIVLRLQQIVEAEGVAADAEALETIARRAAGSMRDSQSLLEQLLACGGERLTTDEVNRLLGTAGGQRLATLAAHLAAGDPAGALADLDAAIADGVDPGQLMDQLLGYFRDLMVAAVGCSADAFQFVGRAEQRQVASLAGQIGLETILACMQIIDATLNRMRYTSRGRTLTELALVRICRLGNLEELATVIAQIKTGQAPTLNIPSRNAITATAPTESLAAASLAAAASKQTAASKPTAASSQTAASKPTAASSQTAASAESAATEAKKKDAPSSAGEFLDAASVPVDGSAGADSAPALNSDRPIEDAASIWREVLARQTDMIREMASAAAAVAILAPNRLVATFAAEYNHQKSYCERPEPVSRFEQSLQQVVGRPMRMEFVVEKTPATAGVKEAKPAQILSNRDRLAQKMTHPLVERCVETLHARPLRLDEP